MQTVTALIPVRNGERFLPEFLKSIAQICSDKDEILFINDGSSDKTARILEDFCKQNNSRRVEINPGQGLVDALNFGFSIARNEWVARFDVDDIYEEFRLNFQKPLIGELIAAVFCDYKFQGTNGEHLGLMTSGIASEINVISLLNNWRTPHPGVLINKKLFFAVNGYLQDEYPVEDLGLWLRLKDVGDLVSVPEVLFNYCLNPNSISSNNRKLMLEKKSQLLMNHDNLKSSISDLERRLWTIYREYSQFPDVMDRKLLLLFDYFTVLRRNKISLIRNRNFLLLCVRILPNPLAFLAFAKIIYFKNKRAKYRVSQL